MSGTETVRNVLESILDEINYNDSKVDIKPVSSGGANYTSGLYEVTVVDEHKDTLHLFAKVGIMNDNMRQDLGSQTVYEIEDKVYRELATAYEEIQDKHGIPKDERFLFSKFYGSSLEVGNETFIFENLNLKGYQIYDRFKPLDHQCLFDTTTALAKFHALGLTLKKERPELHAQFRLEKMISNMNHFVDSSQDQVQNYIKSLDEQYRGTLEKYLEDGGYDKYKKLFTHPGTFLIHADFRGSNIMYKKEGDKVAVVPVDYQSVHLGSPVTDLLYFITTSTDETFRVNHFEELVEHYYEQLYCYLKKLSVDANVLYARQTFHDEVKELLPGTLLLAITMFPLIMVKSNEAPVVSDNAMSMKSFFVEHNAISAERLEGYLRDCVRWGII